MEPTVIDMELWPEEVHPRWGVGFSAYMKDKPAHLVRHVTENPHVILRQVDVEIEAILHPDKDDWWFASIAGSEYRDVPGIADDVPAAGGDTAQE